MRLHHLTINTGHTAVHRVDTITPDIIALAKPLVREGDNPLPNPPWRVLVMRGKGCATFGFAKPDHPPAVLCGMAWQPAAASDVWARLHYLAGATPSQMPPLPWLAVILLAGIHGQPDQELSIGDVSWMGDAERVLAAAILHEEISP